MSSVAATFVDLCLEGRALLDEVDDYVDQWHDGPSTESLASYLGMTEDEYAVWVEKPGALPFILFSRKRGLSLEESLRMSEGQRLAARSAEPADADAILVWLRKTGRLAG